MTKNPIFLMYFVDYNVEIVVFGGGRPLRSRLDPRLYIIRESNIHVAYIL